MTRTTTHAKHTHAEDDHLCPPVPGDPDADALATRRSKTFDFRFDRGAFCPCAGPRTAGAWTARSRPARAQAYAKWYRGEPFDWDWAEAEQAPAAPRVGGGGGAHVRLRGGVARAVAGAIPNAGRRMVLEQAGGDAHDAEEEEEKEDEETDDDDDDDDDEDDEGNDSDSESESESEPDLVPVSSPPRRRGAWT